MEIAPCFSVRRGIVVICYVDDLCLFPKDEGIIEEVET